METKICKDCLIEYPLDQLKQNKRYKDGYEPRCKKCNTIRTKKYRANNINKERAKGRERAKKYKEDPQYIAYVAQWRIDNKEKIAKNRRQYRKHQRKNNPICRVSSNLRSRIASYIRNKGWVKEGSITKSIGCSSSEFVKHIEGQFDNKMNWANYGDYWEIDHILPLSSAKTIDEVYKLNHYTNLQPLYWKDNRKKGAKII